MGIDTNAILTSAPTATDLLIWANKRYKKARLQAVDLDGDHFWLHFEDGQHERSLSVFVGNCVACDYADIYTGDATYVSMGMWGNSDAIVRKLVARFGGWFRINDCEDDWVRLSQGESGRVGYEN